MNIFTKYTYASLTKNKSRTVVTIIGIVLSVAMFTAVTGAVASAYSYITKYTIAQTGAYHGYAEDLTQGEVSSLKLEQDIKDVAVMETVGYADIGSRNKFKPYLYVTSVSDNFTDLVSVHLTSGRLPKSSSEILLPDHLYSNGGIRYAVGDKLTLDIGKRMAEGDELTQRTSLLDADGERLVVTAAKSYTVVGTYDRFSTLIEPYSSPGYTALTMGDKGESAYAFFTTDRAWDAYDIFESLNGKYGRINANSDLLLLNFASSTQPDIINMMLAFAAILIGIIMFGSVSLIYNSFSISVSERTKQFGILKSLGATKRQVMRSVLKEALMLCAVAVPLGLISGCVGIGITLNLLSDSFTYWIGTEYDIRLTFVFSPIALAIASVIGVVTTVISAWIPARRAVRIPPLEAVRHSGDVKMPKRRGGKYRLTQALFGFEGMIAAKNFRRNKKRYRAAIMSLFVSVVLFISASSFCAYLTGAAEGVSNIVGYDIYFRSYNDLLSDEEYAVLADVKGVDDSALTVSGGYSGEIPLRYLSDKYIDFNYNEQNTDSISVHISVQCLDDKSYNELAKKVGVTDTDGAIVCNSAKHYDEGGKIISHDTLDEKTAKDGFTVKRLKSIDGYSYYGEIDGIYCYSKIGDELEDDEGILINEESMLRLTAEQAYEEQSIRISGYTTEEPYYADGNGFVLYYPMSKLDEVIPQNHTLTSTVYFLARDHKTCFDNIQTAISEMEYEKGYTVQDLAELEESSRAIVTIVNVFSYGFIILISLIALANVFNTVTTNIYLRRRELAMLKSVGMTKGGFNKMMNYECIICGTRGIASGLPVAVAVTFLIYLATSNGFSSDFFVPWYSIVISVFSVFVVVFSAMLYSMHKLKKENVIDTLRNENI